VYNFHTDADHPRGLWRRATLASYLDEPEWDILLDVDALGAQEGESWVFGGANLRRPNFDRALITLKPGGSDANVVREFDLETRTFISDGFTAPASKGSMSWMKKDSDSVLIARDFGAGTLTDSGYPRSVRLWRRGTDIDEAPIILEG
ncbi:S9 family peptidase, partial [Leclercia adecarboxylata]|nr:S9 family peptidase [Leclercia adecarboxylata]